MDKTRDYSLNNVSLKFREKSALSSSKKVERARVKLFNELEKNDTFSQQKEFKTDLVKPKFLPKSTKPKHKVRSKIATETKCIGPTTDPKIRMDMHELLVIRPMQESPDANCAILKKSEELMETFIAETEKQLFDKFDTSLQYMIAYRKLNQILQESTYREKVSSGTISAKKMIQLALDGKSTENGKKIKRKKTKKKDSVKNDVFNIFDLMKFNSPTVSSGCDLILNRTSPIEIVEER